MRFWFSLFVISLWPASFARAGEVATFGRGTNSCAIWTKNLKDGGAARTADLAWVTGFVTGYNIFGPPGSETNAEVGGMFGWIDGYCAKRPKDEIVDAAMDLIEQLRNRPLAGK